MLLDAKGSNPPVDLIVHNEIPLASGLGSSAAAIVAGIKLAGLISATDLSDQTIQNYATEFEGHPDNVTATLCGGFVASCVDNSSTVITTRFDWPAHIRAVVVSPRSQLPTHVARAASREASPAPTPYTIFNDQRSSSPRSPSNDTIYFGRQCAIRLHQPRRESLVAGLAEALALPRMPGLLGVALSGAGPSIVALVDANEKQIGNKIASCFKEHKIQSVVRVLDVDNEGCRVVSSTT